MGLSALIERRRDAGTRMARRVVSGLAMAGVVATGIVVGLPVAAPAEGATASNFNPGTIIIFGPIMAALWLWLGKRGLEPNVPVKFGMALVGVGAGFLLLVWASHTQVNDAFKVPLIWLFLAYFLHSIAELMLSPVGLSMITKLSVPRMVGMMMGAWFMASALAHIVAGLVAKSTSTETVGGVVTDPALALATYAKVFQEIGLWGVGIGIALLLGSPILKWMMRGVK